MRGSSIDCWSSSISLTLSLTDTTAATSGDMAEVPVSPGKGGRGEMYGVGEAKSSPGCGGRVEFSPGSGGRGSFSSPGRGGSGGERSNSSSCTGVSMEPSWESRSWWDLGYILLRAAACRSCSCSGGRGLVGLSVCKRTTHSWMIV